jgi:uncharacterized cupin superfamily protein
MKRVNLFTQPVEHDKPDPEGRAGVSGFGPSIGGSVYELGPGQAICPDHDERGNEEWLLVLEGSVTLRHPEGEEQLERGEVVWFPIGRKGPHKVSNPGEESARVLIVSTTREPAVAIHIES